MGIDGLVGKRNNQLSILHETRKLLQHNQKKLTDGELFAKQFEDSQT
jgi:hypothetical protein